MKKIIALLFVMLCCLILKNNIVVFANEPNNHFFIYTVDNEYLFEKEDIALNDIYIAKDLKMYEITHIDYSQNKAFARFVKQLKKPNVSVNKHPTQISTNNKKIGLYLTHNDESFVPSDGYDSIYGAGGIHDVARALKNSLQQLGVEVELNETLHIPHDYLAYSRSEKTAKTLLKNNADAVFDIHRDGTSRSYYATNYNGEERCKIRIVVGQANPNKDENLQFALSLLSVAEKMYPWLFADIYFAKGHYNQELNNKMLLFEMGTYLIEKELVLNSVTPLANVINTVLFNTTINEENGDLVVGGTVSETTPTINEHLNKVTKSNQFVLNVSVILTCVLVVVAAVAFFVPLIILDSNKE